MNNIEQYITEYGKDIYSFCVYLTGSRDLADDLYQQTFLVAIEKGGIDGNNNPKSFLLSVAVNVWRNMRRRLFFRRSRTEYVFTDDQNSFDIADPSPDGEELAVIRERNDEIRRAVMELPEKMRQVVILFYTEDMKITEIAEILRISEGTVKSRLHSAKKKLRERLEHYERL